MTKNQSLCFLKSKTNRTDYWVFPPNAKRRPIAVETPIYFVLTHFSNYHNSLHVKQTKNRLWIWQDSCERPCLEIPCRDYRQYGDHLFERNIPLIGHYGLYWPLAINYNAKQRHLLFHSNTISAELNDFSSRELLFFSGNKKDHRIFSVSQQHLCKFSWSDCAKNKEFRNVKIIKTYKWCAWIRYWWDHF